MKTDKFTKVILTIIALCLVWICVRDIKIGPAKLYANEANSGQAEIYLTGVDRDAFIGIMPIPVMVMNPPSMPKQ